MTDPTLTRRQASRLITSISRREKLPLIIKDNDPAASQLDHLTYSLLQCVGAQTSDVSLNKLTVSVRKQSRRPLSDNLTSGGTVLFVNWGGMALTVDGMSSINNLKQRIRTHTEYARQDISIQERFIATLSEADTEDNQATKWWEDELSLFRASQLSRRTDGATGENKAITRRI